MINNIIVCIVYNLQSGSYLKTMFCQVQNADNILQPWQGCWSRLAGLCRHGCAAGGGREMGVSMYLWWVQPSITMALTHAEVSMGRQAGGKMQIYLFVRTSEYFRGIYSGYVNSVPF